MKKVKLIEIIPNLGNGGAEKLVFDLCNNYNKEKFDLTLLLYYNDFESKYYKTLKNNGVNIITLNKSKGFSFSFFLKVAKVLNKINPDVIHTHLYSCLYLLPYIFFNKKKKVFHTVHNMADKELDKRHKKVMKWLYYYRNVKPVAISDTVYDSIIKNYNLKKENVIKIYNGVDLNTYCHNKLRKKANNFIAIGRFSPQKNYELMIKAFAKAKQLNNYITLTILGDGEKRTEIEKLTDINGLGSSIRFMGNVDKVEKYLDDADCFLMSSDYEGLPLSMIEAMANGLPIVATKAGGIVDLVKEGENGFLCDIGDEEGLANNIIKISNLNNVENLSQKSINLSKEFSLKKCIKNYENLFLDKSLIDYIG